jgi:ribosomal protein S18 acetylase RimI-like enzyme
MARLKEGFSGNKTGKTCTIYEGGMPDHVVFEFLSTLDEEGRRKFRHNPNGDDEWQFFALVEERGFKKIVAYGAIYPKDEDKTSIDLAIVVHPSWRGEKLGTRMYKMAEELAIKHGKEWMVGEVDADNEVSIHLLKKRGYSLYGPIYQIRKKLEQ